MKRVFIALAALLVAGAVAGAAAASGGKGGGGVKPVLPAPPIAPGTFDGIGGGPVYVHDSFGHVQRTRYAQNGSVVDVVDKPDVNGVRAEFPNNRTETWFGTTTSGAASWKLAVGAPSDPFEPYTPLQDGPFGHQDGVLAIVGAELGAPDTRPAALLPFPAPTGSASTVSGDVTETLGRTAIGFSSSAATTRNFETGGQVWLEADTSGLFSIGGNIGVGRWTFHTGGSSGRTLAGTYPFDFGTGFDRLAVSYDPAAHVATASVDGQVVASVPYVAQPIEYVGVEGSLHANIDNFTVRAGGV
jgi:hypothetical protein